MVTIFCSTIRSHFWIAKKCQVIHEWNYSNQNSIVFSKLCDRILQSFRIDWGDQINFHIYSILLNKKYVPMVSLASVEGDLFKGSVNLASVLTFYITTRKERSVTWYSALSNLWRDAPPLSLDDFPILLDFGRGQLSTHKGCITLV